MRLSLNGLRDIRWNAGQSDQLAEQVSSSYQDALYLVGLIHLQPYSCQNSPTNSTVSLGIPRTHTFELAPLYSVFKVRLHTPRTLSLLDVND